MCGFCGFTGESDNATLSLMSDKIKHRGPDVSKSFTNENISAAFCGFYETTLFFEENQLVILHDGEHDSGNLSQLYSQHGNEITRHIHGAFAFLIYDIKENKILAARDRFGIKPFYYAIVNSKLIFASEIKSILAHPSYTPTLNTDALEQYLSFQYSVLPETFFKGIYRLAPAEQLTFHAGELTVEKYWQPEFKQTATDFNQSVSDIETAVLTAAEQCTSEDAGSFLSGGVDSGFIAACFKPQKCFTVGYENNNYSETADAKALANHLGIQHITKTITPDEYFQILPKAMYYMDEPLADPAAIAFYFACETAAQHVKVAYSGEGPDEFFGGYNQYFEPHALGKIAFIPMKIRQLVSRFLSKLPFSIKGMGYFIRAGKTVEERFIGNAHIFTQQERNDILKAKTNTTIEEITKPLYEKAQNYDDITKMQYIDINLWLAGDILHQADRMSMAHSLLLKTPFMNQSVIDIALDLPTKFRVTAAKNKIAFREAAAKHLPANAAQKKKWGFPVPLRHWLREDKFYDFTKNIFTSEAAENFFHAEKILKLLEQHKNNKADNSRKIWTVLIFLIWYKQFFEIPKKSDGGNNETE